MNNGVGLASLFKRTPHSMKEGVECDRRPAINHQSIRFPVYVPVSVLVVPAQQGVIE